MEKEKWWENHKNARIHTLIDHLVALNHVTNDRRYKSTGTRRLSLVSHISKDETSFKTLCNRLFPLYYYYYYFFIHSFWINLNLFCFSSSSFLLDSLFVCIQFSSFFMLRIVSCEILWKNEDELKFKTFPLLGHGTRVAPDYCCCCIHRPLERIPLLLLYI